LLRAVERQSGGGNVLGATPVIRRGRTKTGNLRLNGVFEAEV